MKSSAQLKADAKEVLRGRWGSAILLNLIPSILSILASLVLWFMVVAIFAFGAFFLSDNKGFQDVVNEVSQTTESYTNQETTIDEDGDYDYQSGWSWNTNFGGLLGSILGTLFMSGISWTFLDLLRRQKDTIQPFKDATRGFTGLFIGGVILIALLTYIFTFLWTMLLIIPGIVKSYSYSQSYLIYYDTITNTGRKPKVLDTITASRHLMDGHKGRLFWLDLSFIGWHILAVMTFGIGYLWLNPYIAATKAAFYNDLPKEVAYS